MVKHRTTRSRTTRATVEVAERTLDDLADDLLELSERSLKRVLYGALDEVAEEAQRRLKDVFEHDIEGGPVDYTRIKPGSKTSSVVANTARKAKGGGDTISSNLRVQKKQSTYLKYALGDEGPFTRQREPGDVGAAEKHNYVPKAGLAKIGMAVTAEGNLQKRTLKALSSASQRKKAKRPRRAKPGEAPKIRDMPIFYGRSGRRKTIGFWLRSPRDGEDSDRAPTLLALSLQQSDYDDDILITGWNRSAEEAMEGLPLIVKRRLGEVLDRMAI